MCMSERIASKAPVVILSTADYDSPVWTNKQHIASRLAENRRVHYINSIGLRRPTVSSKDARRIVERVLTTRPQKQSGGLPLNIEVQRPVVLPFHGNPVARTVNTRLLPGTVKPVFDLADSVLWSFSPMTYGLEERCGRFIYHSVDLLHELPGVPKRALLSAERRALSRADIVIASSEGVRRHLQELGRSDVILWENVADVELYSSFGGPKLDRAIFAGNLTPTKVDYSALRDIAATGYNVVLAGPTGIDGTGYGDELAALLAIGNVEYLGNLKPTQLAEEVAKSKIGLIPYRLNAYTQGVFPMKVYEYIAAGCRVVATPLPSLTEKTIVGLELVPSANFADSVLDQAASMTTADANELRNSASSYSWTRRIREANDLLDSITR